jgi:hypothetical protein
VRVIRELGDAPGGRAGSLTSSPREKLIKIGAKVVSHGCYVPFQMVEVAEPRQMFKDILMLIARCGRGPLSMKEALGRGARTTMGKVRLNEGK